jgi:pimeloyl-ACP methyl ester carboxylesterase
VELARPDGARIQYEVRGEGPAVVLNLGYMATPEVYEGIAADLARDHRVVTWDPRGCGRSSQEGPFDISTDADDFAAVAHEVGPPVTVFAIAHGVNIAALAAERHPELLRALVSPGVATAVLEHLEGTEGFGGSPQVIEMLVEQFRRDPRASARATVASLNPQLDEDALRYRVDQILEYTDVDVTLARIESWLADDGALPRLQALGDRLAVPWHEADPWQAGSVDRLAELLPQARIERVADGPLTRPDLPAQIVREMS